MKVIILGTVSVYERDGVYQIYCKGMREDGLGSLHVAYEELKAKLEKEGLFDQKYKKPIPKMPKCIGVLTSNTGAVIRDIINVSTRRNPNVHIRLLPVPVQGEGASVKIANAIKIMNERNLADVIILARGGGSLEDLWPFNEEIVARAIFDSELPVISAVGHETDFSISDFVADLRAPTPSAAAELAVPNMSDVLMKLDNYNFRYKNSLKKKIEVMRLRYEKCMMHKAFKDPLQSIQDKYVYIDNINKSMQLNMNNKIQSSRTKMVELITKLDNISPLKTLTRGYSIIEKNDIVVKSVNDLNIDDEINIRLIDGVSKAKICGK